MSPQQEPLEYIPSQWNHTVNIPTTFAYAFALALALRYDRTGNAQAPHLLDTLLDLSHNACSVQMMIRSDDDDDMHHFSSSSTTSATTTPIETTWTIHPTNVAAMYDEILEKEAALVRKYEGYLDAGDVAGGVEAFNEDVLGDSFGVRLDAGTGRVESAFGYEDDFLYTDVENVGDLGNFWWGVLKSREMEMMMMGVEEEEDYDGDQWRRMGFEQAVLEFLG